MKQVTGVIFDIQRFSINDGPGIRTNVFVKGCPLRCRWCHNAESLRPQAQLRYRAASCVGCGACVSACEQGVHTITKEGHVLNRAACVACGNCAEACCYSALEILGRRVTVEEVLEEVERDKAFYETSNGGLTLTGGEPTAQSEFAVALLTEAKARGLHTCVETCGFAPWAVMERLAAVTDLFLYDYKETDAAKHKEFTGVDNERILENLYRLDEMGCQTVLRCPIIPTLNDRPDHFEGICRVANRLKHLTEINIEPYHSLGSDKYTQLGETYALETLPMPSDETVAEWIKTVQAGTSVPVKKA